MTGLQGSLGVTSIGGTQWMLAALLCEGQVWVLLSSVFSQQALLISPTFMITEGVPRRATANVLIFFAVCCRSMRK
jgi:hypothetical protein